MATINGYYIMVEKESPDFPVTITQQPTDKGVDISDHVQKGLKTLSLSGSVTGEKSSRIRDFLKNAEAKGVIVKFVGRNSFVGLISSFSTDHEYRNAEGFDFSLTLVEAQIANSSYTDTLPLPVKAQVVKIVNSGTKQKKTTKKSSSTKKTKSKKSSKSGKSSKPKSKKASKAKDAIVKVKFKKGSPFAT